MHELSIMTGILDIVLEYAQKNDATKVNAVNLRIGALSDIIPDWAQTYFDMLSKDTIAEDAKLNIEKVPLKIRCNACGHEHTFEGEELNIRCSACDSINIEIITGRELSVSSIVID